MEWIVLGVKRKINSRTIHYINSHYSIHFNSLVSLLNEPVFMSPQIHGPKRRNAPPATVNPVKIKMPQICTQSYRYNAAHPAQLTSTLNPQQNPA